MYNRKGRKEPEIPANIFAKSRIDQKFQAFIAFTKSLKYLNKQTVTFKQHGHIFRKCHVDLTKIRLERSKKNVRKSSFNVA